MTMSDSSLVFRRISFPNWIKSVELSRLSLASSVRSRLLLEGYTELILVLVQQAASRAMILIRFSFRSRRRRIPRPISKTTAIPVTLRYRSLSLAYRLSLCLSGVISSLISQDRKAAHIEFSLLPLLLAGFRSYSDFATLSE